MLALSVVCIVAGTVLLMTGKAEAAVPGGALIAAGIGGFGKEVHVAKKTAKNEQARADEATRVSDEVQRELFEKTGTLYVPKTQCPPTPPAGKT